MGIVDKAFIRADQLSGGQQQRVALSRPLAQNPDIHHVELALNYADRIVGIKDGKIVYDGSSSEVTEEILETIYKGKVEVVA